MLCRAALCYDVRQMLQLPAMWQREGGVWSVNWNDVQLQALLWHGWVHCSPDRFFGCVGRVQPVNLLPIGSDY